MKSWAKSKIRKYLGPVLVVVGLAYTYHSHITGCPRYVILRAGHWDRRFGSFWSMVCYMTQKMKTLAYSNITKVSAETFGWDSWPI